MIKVARPVRQLVVQEVAVRTEHSDPGTQGLRTFRMAEPGRQFAVGHSRKPHLPGGALGLHISISKIVFDGPHLFMGDKVTKHDLHAVRQAIEAQGLPWPDRYHLTKFEVGPFAGLGVHVWQIA